MSKHQIEIDRKLLLEAKEYMGAKTFRETVNRVLEEAVASNAEEQKRRRQIAKQKNALLVAKKKFG